MKSKSTLTEILRRIAHDIVFHQEHLEVAENTMGSRTVFTVRVHYADKGRLIGKEGATFNALRAVLRQMGVSSGKLVTIDRIATSIDGPPERYGKFKYRSDWDRDRVLDLFDVVCKNLSHHPDQVEVVCLEDPQPDGTKNVTLKASLGPDDVGIPLELQAAMDTLFNAIGRKNGRLIAVAFVEEDAVRV